MVRKRDVEVNTAKQITLWEIGELVRRRGERRKRRPPSGQSMKYLLDVLVLLELVDEGEHFRGLLFG